MTLKEKKSYIWMFDSQLTVSKMFLFEMKWGCVNNASIFILGELSL